VQVGKEVTDVSNELIFRNSKVKQSRKTATVNYSTWPNILEVVNIQYKI